MIGRRPEQRIVLMVIGVGLLIFEYCSMSALATARVYADRENVKRGLWARSSF